MILKICEIGTHDEIGNMDEIADSRSDKNYIRKT